MASSSWLLSLESHPIFSDPPRDTGSNTQASTSENGASKFPSSALAQRRLCIRDKDLIVAVGSEIRMTPINLIKGLVPSRPIYKCLETPNLTFPIVQTVLSPNEKLLAISGTHCVSVAVLPRDNYIKSIKERPPCRYVSVGQFYHHEGTSAPVAQIGWHPWGVSGSTLLVLTVDGVLREYDISVNPEVPTQTFHLLPRPRGPRRGLSLNNDLAVSFAFGKGYGDWGPLTLYTLSRGGDLYAMCPYLPQNASVPFDYIKALDKFVSEKQARMEAGYTAGPSPVSLISDQQRKYSKALLRQALNEEGATAKLAKQNVEIHPPKSFDAEVSCQGPFLLQPSPHELPDSDGGDATDIVYMAVGDGDANSEQEQLGIILLAFEDGKIDVCLDVQKIEAKWDMHKQEVLASESPLLLVYESLDLKISERIQKSPGSTEGTSVSLLVEPSLPGTVMAYHAFGVHCCAMSGWSSPLRSAISKGSDAIRTALEYGRKSSVSAVFTTPQIGISGSEYVVSVARTDEGSLPSALLILMSNGRLTTFETSITQDTLPTQLISGLPASSATFSMKPHPETDRKSTPTPKPNNAASYISLLALEPFKWPTVVFKPIKVLANTPELGKAEFGARPDGLRSFSQLTGQLRKHIRHIIEDTRVLRGRIALQDSERRRQNDLRIDLSTRLRRLTDADELNWTQTVERIQTKQTSLVSRSEALLQIFSAHMSPELSLHERQWFSEVQNSSAEVLGKAEWDDQALVNRVSSVRYIYLSH
ncbi:hypothetical protein SISSUDRAFT_1105020 [Sistotremastrum suecicum HHB10207 ss-3]|uniref:Uncharacterized protein n=1 Tax=Sistotremastrum suecicum HHB10207 ss-3 TaxID=1314776 RepID=A0A166HRV9_9AGAM|nr:hypothetical protein SISSUDRAFT_1105020 [Sistotremastrum suecicum HHB10207 ss-3]